MTQEKHFYTISEVSEICSVKPHVLRYWEKEFDSLQPSTRRGKRRYYQTHDIEHIHTIRRLLYDEGFTISGAKAKLEGNDVIKIHRESEQKQSNPPSLGQHQMIIEALEDIAEML